MSKYVPIKLTQLSANESAAVDAINRNLDSIEEHINDSVSRSAKTPSQMTADLDMNGKKIINIGAPTTPTDLVRQQDVVEDKAEIKQMHDDVMETGSRILSAAEVTDEKVQAASNYATLSQSYSNNSKLWAEGTDVEVAPLGGTHSAKGWADVSEAAAGVFDTRADKDLSNITSAGQGVISSASASKAEDNAVVHNSGNENVAGDKTFSGVIKSKNPSYTGNYLGYYYQQGGGPLISGLRSGDTWLNYIQFNVDGSVKIGGTVNVDTPASTDNSTKIATTEFVNTAISSAQTAPRDKTTLYTGSGAIATNKYLQLSESWQNFEELVFVGASTSSSGNMTAFRLSTYWLNELLTEAGSSGDVMIWSNYIGSYLEVAGYNASTPSTTSDLYVNGHVNGYLKYVFGINRKPAS